MQEEIIPEVTVEEISTRNPGREEVTTREDGLEEVTREFTTVRVQTTSPNVRQEVTRDNKPELKTRTNLEGAVVTNRVTSNFMRMKRRLQWEIEHDWEEEDLERKIESTEALEEDLQDFEKPMVIIGGDVVSLYPNLDIQKIVEKLDLIIKESGIKWSNVDMMEGARYLALNWTREQVRTSSLRRIIPWRRHRTSNRSNQNSGYNDVQ